MKKPRRTFLALPEVAAVALCLLSSAGLAADPLKPLSLRHFSAAVLDELFAMGSK